MTAVRAWLHTALSDLRARLRDRRFLLMMAACIYLGHSVLTGRIELTLGGRTYRGVENAAWMGTVLSLSAAFLLTVFGFYLVRGVLARDRQARTAPLVASSPVRSVTYLLGKWAGGTVFLLLLAGSMALSLAVLFALDGPGLPAPGAILTPFLLVVVPVAAAVTAVALAFECLPGLGGTVGGVLYFMGAVAVVTAPAFGPVPLDLLSMRAFHDSMTEALLQQYPEADLGPMFTFGYFRDAAGELKVFPWDGIALTADLVARRAGLVLGSAVLVAGAALPFGRFDPSPAWWAQMGAGLPSSDEDPSGPAARDTPSASAASPDSSVAEPPSRPASLGRLSASLSLRPLRLFLAEGRRALWQRSWTWHLGALALIGAGWGWPTHTGLLVVAWLWPMPLWSDLGVRETVCRVAPLVDTALYPRAQRVAAWAVGSTVALALVAGPVLWGGQWAALVGVFFVPALALAAGRLSHSPRLFEIVYLVLWYIGVANQTAALDFGGVAQAPTATLLGYSVAAAGLLAAAVLWSRSS